MNTSQLRWALSVHLSSCSSVIIVTGLRTGEPRFHSRHGRDFVFVFATAFTNDMGHIQRGIHWVPALKWPGRETDHSPESGAEVRNAWSYTSTLLIRAWCLIKQWILNGVLSYEQEQPYLYVLFSIN
jgi:hypothetical protein